ncbi:unnamed protein product [Prorocentrum cordatum]|uniref:Mei2-like C-terminal RNA recognition motif domain-containing protein n=1 Tax=Prorocentrum cordatum TaxID=2364126 RepID=A0ABN9SDU3_9DINO|nr:unnamed protein product [Polarella glacialis]
MIGTFENASGLDMLSKTQVSFSREEPMKVGRLHSPGFISRESVGKDTWNSRDSEDVVDPLFPMWVHTQSFLSSSTISECSSSADDDSQQTASSDNLHLQQRSGSPCSPLSVKATRSDPELKMGKMESADGLSSDQRTTVMMRNLPTTFTRARLIDLLNSKGFSGQFDLIYLPIDFGSACNLGYAFVNMTTHQQALHFWKVFHGFAAWTALGCRKVCAVCWGAVQGLRANVARYRNCPIMCKHAVPDDYKPALFQSGMQIPFPLKASRSKAMLHRSARIQMPALCGSMRRGQ